MSKLRELPEGFSWKIRWEYDEDGWATIQDFFGDFLNDSDGSDFLVDVKKGWLLGPAGKDSEAQFVWAGDYPEEIIDRDGVLWTLDDEDEGWYSSEGRMVLRQHLPRYRGENGYRYWSSQNCDRKDIQEYGLEATIHDAVEDYKRHLGWVHDDWTFECCAVSLLYREEELGFESSCGIESDRDNAFTEETEEDLMWEALSFKMLHQRYLKASATFVGSESFPETDEIRLDAAQEMLDFKAMLALYPLIQEERQAIYNLRMGIKGDTNGA